ncbi:carotenoid biosynthesis protein [Gemmatimonas aurantiaca]|uniref:carotenoid biosynthesis protein n=1 Tax=Gemmatimonas aurantiaca TaxID=173480 RepID=UPI00301E5F19
MTEQKIPQQTPPTSLLRVAVLALVAHAVFSAFSAFAFATFLVPPYPEWLQTPTNQRAMAIGYTWGGQTTVVLGAIAGLAFLMHAIGKRLALITFVVAFVLALSSELAGTATGFPFGAYGYTDQLGYKIGGLVPFNIPTSWFYMLVASLAICGRTLAARDDNASKWWWSLVASLVLTAWDVSMDPAMVKTRHWLWLGGDLSDAPALLRLIGTPFFFGMPLTNWLGWILTGVLVARAMLAIVPPTTWARQVAPHTLPLVLYAVNGLLPLTICFAQDMVLAGVLGTIAMGLPLLLAFRRRLPQHATQHATLAR